MSGDRGSVLALVPATVLVLVMLSAIAVDSAYVFLAQRTLAAEVASAANDIAGLALNDDAFYRDGTVSLSEDAAAAHVADRFRRPPEPLMDVSATVTVSGDTVTVRATGRVRRIFSPAIPGMAVNAEVRAVTSSGARTDF